MLRCAYCHEAGTLTSCAGCATLLHAECWSEVRRCPTLGCVTTPSRLPRTWWPRATRRSRVARLAAAALLVVAGVLAGAPPDGGISHVELPAPALVLHADDPMPVAGRDPS